MAAMASSRHSASWPGETPSSCLWASMVSPCRIRGTNSVLRRLEPGHLSWPLDDPAAGLRPPCRSISQMQSFFIMVGIVLTSCEWVSREIVHQPSRCFAESARHQLDFVSRQCESSTSFRDS
jgi:hypothetical protein